jgi:hypothetical protein
VKRQAETLTEDKEDILWEKGLLGDHMPQTLFDTMVFYNGLYFALRSGIEHRLSLPNPTGRASGRKTISPVHGRLLQEPSWRSEGQKH